MQIHEPEQHYKLKEGIYYKKPQNKNVEHFAAFISESQKRHGQILFLTSKNNRVNHVS